MSDASIGSASDDDDTDDVDDKEDGRGDDGSGDEDRCCCCGKFDGIEASSAERSCSFCLGGKGGGGDGLNRDGRGLSKKSVVVVLIARVSILISLVHRNGR